MAKRSKKKSKTKRRLKAKKKVKKLETNQESIIKTKKNGSIKLWLINQNMKKNIKNL